MPANVRRRLVLLWLGWFLVLYGFQYLVTARLGIIRPDLAVPWSRTETMATSNRGKIYLLEPFMNRQVAWDSEYYVGIAVGGYDDPAAGRIDRTASGRSLPKNYAFFPFYPALIRVVAWPFKGVGMEPIAAAVAAGVIVTLLGTLAGMMALWHLTNDLFDENMASRAVFYMLIFPSAFFFAMVYSEGLFIGLAFWSLLLNKREKWLGASLLAVPAAWVRAHGAALALPLLWSWGKGLHDASGNAKEQNRKWWLRGGLALLPIGAHLVWRLSPFGHGWAELQPFYFARGYLSVLRALGDIGRMFAYARTNGQAAVYFSLELAAVVLAIVASIWLIKHHRPLALFSLAVILLSLLSGSAQSMIRYVLIAPALYIFLAYVGRQEAFDRVWTIASVLLLGMLAMLFAFDMWVG